MNHITVNNFGINLFMGPKKRSVIFLLVGGLILMSCISKKEKTIQVKNTASIDRVKEVVSVDLSLFKDLNIKPESLEVKNKSTSEVLLTQLVDLDFDGVYDQLLFQATVKAKETQEYVITKASKKIAITEEKVKAYSRIVPERTDDYTWENDKVAFRTYGPEAQRLVEANKPGGTLSSGIDLWLKRVEYSIIDKWYAENVKAPGYYHIDHGEGHDPYHVGKSRGAGGIGIWENDRLWTSKNFIEHRTITTGPLRTVFELDYAPWGPYNVKETKRVTLDLGSNFSKFQVQLKSEKDVPNYTIGITLHDKLGETNEDIKAGWFRHWEPMQDSFLGEGIVVASNVVEKSFSNLSSTPDQSQLLIVTKPQSELTFYVGFAWVKSKQVKNKTEWDAMLERQAIIASNPLVINVVK